MSLLKQRISSPLEAGPSILDSQNLPPHLTEALEYTSKRLSRKALHVTLVVVRKEYQLPSCAFAGRGTPSVSAASTPATPNFILEPASASATQSRFSSPVAGLRDIVRRGTAQSTTTVERASSRRSTTSQALSPGFPSHHSESLSSPRRWPLTPNTPRTPMTPHTPSSTTTTSTSTSNSSTASVGGPNPFGICLIYATRLTPRAERILRTTIAKAERRFQTGTGWLLPPAATAEACGLNTDLIRRSIRQNEVLLSAEGLTLLGLDRLYTFKSALAAYARTTLPSFVGSSGDTSSRIEGAVDELRRLVLAHDGKRTNDGKGRLPCKEDLHRRYEWIGVSASALGDVDRMYRRAYGGPKKRGAFMEDIPNEPEQEDLSSPMVMSFASRPASTGIVKIGTPPGPKGPALKLQTTFAEPTVVRPVPVKMRNENEEILELEIKIDGLVMSDDEDGDMTARPTAASAISFWNGVGPSIDEVLQAQEDSSLPSAIRGNNARISRLSQLSGMGPATPNGYDDISPITRGEWGFLFNGDSWNRGKTAAVETC